MQCNQIQNDRRRKFWVTQPNACGIDDTCRGGCGKPGLSFISSGNGRTISNDQYVRGLALNILLTDGRKDPTTCGVHPGTRGGYWADSFRTDGRDSGSLIRFIKPSGRIQDDMFRMRAVAERDLQKLVSPYGVASSVRVEANYLGRGVASLDVEIIGTSGETYNVGVTGSRLENGWVWK